MAIYAPLKTQPSPRPPNQSASAKKTGSWVPLVAATGVLAISVLATISAATTLRHNQVPPSPSQPLPAAPPAATFADSDVNAAKAKACSAWDTAATEMTQASNAVSRQPPGWDDPDRVRARANETRVVIVETAYLRSQVDPATPAVVRGAIERYNALSIAQQNASAQRLGTVLDKLINDQNMVSEQIKTHCGLQ